MSSAPNPAAVRRLLRLAGPSPASTSDRELVRRFVLDRSEAAFADLMARHGPMVLAVCRRHLRDPHAADDAFQATFLVLARRAATVKWKDSIAGWLFEVASRVGRKAAAREARRAAREGAPAEAAPEPVAQPAPVGDLTALQAALDDELRRLPEKLRVPVVLCHLEGLSQDEVARHLGVSDGQLRGRLYRARQKLQDRLTRRGFSLTTVLLSLTVGPRALALPPVLAAATLRLAGPGSVPDAISALTTAVTQDMTRTIPTLAVALVVVALGAGGFAVRHALAEQPAPPRAASRPAPLPPLAAVQAPDDDDKKQNPKDRVEQVEGVIKAVAADKNQLVVAVEEDDHKADRTVPVAGAKLRFGPKPVTVGDLRPGMEVVLSYKGNSTELLELKAGWPSREVVFKAADPATKSFSIETGGDEGGFEVVLRLDPDAKVTVDELPAGLADLPPNRKVRVELTIDKKGVIGVESDGAPGTLPGLLKRYDAKTNSLLVEVRAAGFREDRVVTVAFPLTANAKVRHAGRDAALTDLKERMPVRLTFTPDRREVSGVLTADPLPPEVNDDD
ncbi:MAG: sigma-70 family RNA polymerase sigma factor [Gemmataceae bacterium]